MCDQLIGLGTVVPTKPTLECRRRQRSSSFRSKKLEARGRLPSHARPDPSTDDGSRFRAGHRSARTPGPSGQIADQPEYDERVDAVEDPNPVQCGVERTVCSTRNLRDDGNEEQCQPVAIDRSQRPHGHSFRSETEWTVELPRVEWKASLCSPALEGTDGRTRSPGCLRRPRTPLASRGL